MSTTPDAKRRRLDANNELLVACSRRYSPERQFDTSIELSQRCSHCRLRLMKGETIVDDPNSALNRFHTACLKNRQETDARERAGMQRVELSPLVVLFDLQPEAYKFTESESESDYQPQPQPQTQPLTQDMLSQSQLTPPTGSI